MNRRSSRTVYLRGLIELSNICRKDCLYCGIRCSNRKVERYELPEAQVLELSQYALDNGYGSVVLQGGERCDSNYVERISALVYKIKHLTSGRTSLPLGITLSLGEQSREVYREWFNSGADRYLLRIEASNPELYRKIHPSGSDDEIKMHSYDRRIEALEDLKSAGYITGSGMMIALPYQTMGDLEHDLNFLASMDVDMVGMGPYIPHRDTPLGRLSLGMKPEGVPPDDGDFASYTREQRMVLSLEMIRRLRKRMPQINIAAATALEVLSEDGKAQAVLSGANVIMPNITTSAMRRNYQLYEGKSEVKDDAESTRLKLERQMERIGVKIGWFDIGNPGKFS